MLKNLEIMNNSKLFPLGISIMNYELNQECSLSFFMFFAAYFRFSFRFKPGYNLLDR